MDKIEQALEKKQEGLSFDQLRWILKYDSRTGIFMRRVAGKWVETKGTKSPSGYVSIVVNGVRYQAHRIAWLYVHEEWPKGRLDHKNRDRSDNRIRNLREVSQTHNMQNQGKAHCDSSSGLLGSYFHKKMGRWYAQIRVEKRLKFLGYFGSAKEAHEAYLDAKRLLHAGCQI